MRSSHSDRNKRAQAHLEEVRCLWNRCTAHCTGASNTQHATQGELLYQPTPTHNPLPTTLLSLTPTRTAPHTAHRTPHTAHRTASSTLPPPLPALPSMLSYLRQHAPHVTSLRSKRIQRPSTPSLSPPAPPPPLDPQQQESSTNPAGLTPAGRWILRSEG
jgi:hypothetical protein